MINTNPMSGLVLRGLLAGASHDEDNPYRRVILRSYFDAVARKHAGARVADPLTDCPVELPDACRFPLTVPAPDTGEAGSSPPEAWAAGLAAHVEKHGQKPDVVLVEDVGIFCVEQPAVEDGGPFHNSVAVVTGAAGAIGAGVCRGLLEKGCHVAATDLAGPRLDALASDLAEGGSDRLMTVPMDVTDRASVAEALDAVTARWGGVDVLVVNAGIAHVAKLCDLDLADFQRLERVNVEGALLTMSEAASRLRLQGTGGDIVVVSTKNVFAPGAGFGAYSATKAACHQLARIASLELAEYDIRVNMVAPDAVFSEEGGRKSGLWAEVGPGRMKARGLDEEGLEDYYRNRNLLKRRVTARHVANAVLFFVSHQTPTTGATLPVDGGMPEATPR